MKDLLGKANENLEKALVGGHSNSVSYAAGYRQAILDVARKLKEEGLDELEDE